ncbi:hypothetical protein HDU87_004025 [Geranomyces variabilis]|uniref:Uncharacterized protein n=1 Tax=Geranomyces variabilis TaxID=109894 RepID=A0AAD5TQZ9_9FUNG|nr:hypothetical protein HDU87_004025 [Geranomyces variabilis]
MSSSLMELVDAMCSTADIEEYMRLMREVTCVKATDPSSDATLLHPEGNLSSDISHGRCEFVYRFLDEVIFKFVEAKKDDLEQGLAQLMLMLDAAHLENLAMGIQMDRLFGAVSTGYSYWLIVYTPSATKSSQRFTAIGDELVFLDYGAKLTPERKVEMLREGGERIFGVFFEGWITALRCMNQEQRLEYSRPTLSADGLVSAPGQAEETPVVDRAVRKAERLLGALRAVDRSQPGSEERLDTLFARLHRLAEAFALKDLEEAMEIDD